MGTTSSVKIKYSDSSSPTLAGLLTQLVHNAQLHPEEAASPAEA